MLLASDRCNRRMTVPEILEKRGPFREEHLAMAKEQVCPTPLTPLTPRAVWWSACVGADRCVVLLCADRCLVLLTPRRQPSAASVSEAKRNQPPLSPPSS